MEAIILDLQKTFDIVRLNDLILNLTHPRTPDWLINMENKFFCDRNIDYNKQTLFYSYPIVHVHSNDISYYLHF